ncbi:MAG: hypothetical protein IPO21_14615 [Bacteroidales bacterium]|nr:hypothetical protein [Bacteroidales bacterium]
MKKVAFKLPEDIKVVSHEIIDNQVVVTYEESKKLHLKVGDSNYLCVKYGNDVIGHISDKGECSIISIRNHRETYLKWVADGMPVDNTEVEWRGKFYKIDNLKRLLSNKSIENRIFNFENAFYYTHCTDSNIQRYPHNNTPIAY